MSTAQKQAVAKEATTHKVLGRLPAGWKAVRLGDVVEKVGSGITPRGGEKVYRMQGVPFVRSQNIGWGELLLDDLIFVAPELHADMRSSELHLNDVLLNISGASIGRAALVNERLVGGNVNQHVCIIRTKRDELDPAFLLIVLLSHNGQKQIDSFQAGGNREGLNYNQIRTFWIPLPPLPEQQRIARILGTWDRAIGLLQEQIAAKELRLRGLIDQLVSGQRHGATNGQLPKGWKWVRLGEVFEFLSTTSHSRSQLTMEADEGDVHYIHYGDIHATYNTPLLDLQRNVHVPKLRHGISIPRSADFLKNGDLILADASEDVDGIGACVELVNVGGCSAISGLHTLALRDKAGLTVPGYRAYLLRSDHAVKRLRQVATGSKVHGVSRTNMAALKVPLPPKEEQAQIAGCVNQAYAELANMNAQLDELHQQKKGLMQELLSGRKASLNQ